MTGRHSKIAPHHKVRTGCYQCKSRRIKCDEQKPRCSRCVRYSEACTYPALSNDSTSISSRSTSEVSGPSRDGPITVPKDLNNSTTELNLGDLELLQNWTMCAYNGFGDKIGDEKLWQDEIPRMALVHPFLMRGILAVSALHMSRTRPEEKPHYLAVAAYHQHLALPSYRYLVEDIEHRMDKENSQAIIAFGRLTIAYAFASPHPPGSILFAGLCASTGVPEWVSLLRGSRGVVSISNDFRIEHPQLPSHTHVIQDFADSIDLSLSPDDYHLAALGEEMDRLPVSSPDEIEEMKIFREALAMLRRAFALPWQPGEHLGVKLSVFTWVGSVPQRYLELLSVLRPVALVIICYMSVMLKECEHYWYIKGAARRIVSEVYNNILGEEWQSWIAWPLQRVLSQ